MMKHSTSCRSGRGPGLVNMRRHPSVTGYDSSGLFVHSALPSVLHDTFQTEPNWC